MGSYVVASSVEVNILFLHEILTEDGTLLFGAIDCSREDSEDWIDEIHTETGLPRRFMLYDSENERIELPLSMAEELVGEIDAPISLS